MSKQSTQVSSGRPSTVAAERRSAGVVAGTVCNHERVRELAYSYWQERGCPNGSPEEDWFRAEIRLSSRAVSAAQ
jgi:hypothetical protein